VNKEMAFSSPLIYRVQGPAKGTTNTSSLPVTLNATPQNGNVLVAGFASYNNGSQVIVSSISQTGVVWTRAPTATFPSSNDVEIWIGVVGLGASSSLTINLSGSPSFGAVADVCEYANVKTVGVDQVAYAGGGGSLTNPYTDTGTTPTTKQANELWVAAIVLQSSNQPGPATHGFTMFDGNTFNNVSLAYCEKIVTSVGKANTGTYAPNVINFFWDGCMITLFAAFPREPECTHAYPPQGVGGQPVRPS
jgi:hypothetical protein